MAEERRISPAVVIIPLGLGLAAVIGIAALAWAAPPKVYTCPYCGAEFASEEELLAHIELEHPKMLAEFAYTSDLYVEPDGGPNDVRFTVDVANIGESAGTLHLKVYDRMQNPYLPAQWARFQLHHSYELVMASGEVRTFSDIIEEGPYTYQVMAKSEAGVLLNPPTPLEYACEKCAVYYEVEISFATQEELAAHVAAGHPH